MVQQKLISILLNNRSDEHGTITPHLKQELEDGWEIKSIHTAAAGEFAKCWITVLLEKS